MGENKNEDFKVTISNIKNVFDNQIVKICHLVNIAINIFGIIAFGLSFIIKQYQFAGGIMSCLFTLIYSIAAFFTIKKNESSTFLSIVYLIMIYAIPCLWLSFWYIFMNAAGLEGFSYYYIYIQFGIILVAILLAVISVSYYYRNNIKYSSFFAFLSLIISIIALLIGGTTEMLRAIKYDYVPLIGILFYLEAIIGILPFRYLLKTI